MHDVVTVYLYVACHAFLYFVLELTYLAKWRSTKICLRHPTHADWAEPSMQHKIQNDLDHFGCGQVSWESQGTASACNFEMTFKNYNIASLLYTVLEEKKREVCKPMNETAKLVSRCWCHIG